MSKRSLKSYFTSVDNAENKRLRIDVEVENEGDNDVEVGTNSKPSRKNVNATTFKKWQKQFPWLEMKEEDLMICKCCKDFAKKEESGFVDGCPALRFETVKKHDASLVHTNACKAKCAKESPSETPLALAIRTMDADLMANVEKLFNTAYLIAKEDYAFEDFRKLCELQRKNGLKIGETYLNDKAARQFVKYIAENMRENLKQQLSTADFFSLMADGSTDRSAIASEIIYLRYLYEGESKCCYIAVTECDDQSANGIKSGIVSILKEFIPSWEKKLVAVSFDGARVNMGQTSGVSKLLENDCGQLVTVHCVAHRLELAIADAMKNVKYEKTFINILKGVYSYYHSSPKRTKELKTVGDILDEKILSHISLYGIRWLQCTHKAVKVLLHNLVAVIIHMEKAASSEPDKVVSAKLKGYLKFLKSERFVRFLCLMQDIMSILAHTSEKFQQRFVSVKDVLYSLASTKNKLNKMISANGETLQQFEEDLNIEGSESDYKGIKLTRKVEELSCFEEQRKLMLTKIIEALDSRYSNIQNDKVLGNLHTLDPCNVVNLNEIENKKIDEDFKNLIEGLPQNISIEKDAVIEEFEDYKLWAKEKLKLPCEYAWQRLMAESLESSSFLNLRKIINFIMIVPLSTAECERGFSHFNLIKRKNRQSLLLSSVDDLLFIRLYGPSMSEYDPHPAMNLWWKDVACGRTRRPDFKK